jgi:hypothetical protein
MSAHPVALLVVVFVAMAVMLLRREQLLTPFFLVAVFLPLSQGFELAALDITFARLLIFVAFLRFLFRGELTMKRWSPMDSALCLWCGIGTVAYVLLWGTFEALVNAVGQIVNYAGTYFLVRICINRSADVASLIKYMRYAAIVLGVFILGEWSTGRNAFAMFGGVPAITEIRDGLFRCQGPFGHPIGAGLFAASLVPIFIGSLVARIQVIQSLAAIASAIFVVWSTASSAPVLALIGGVAAWCFWTRRRNMRAIGWSIVAILAGLHVVMKAPVWALIGRVSIFDSSSSWHRLNLFDQFIRRFDEWWLVGTRSTEHWGFYAQDVANNYVRIGVSGGLFTLLAFLLLVRRGFTSIGAAIRRSDDSREHAVLWSLGAALMAHVVGSFGLSYWDQNSILFAMLLGFISAATSVVVSKGSARAEPQYWEAPESDVAASSRRVHGDLA